MKNFSKKLSFVMATAMVVTSLYAPQGAEAATKNKIVEKNSKSAVKRKNIYIGGQVVDFDAVVKGKVVKDSEGTWKSSDSKIASVDKNGKVKARKNGRVTISFKTKATKKTKSVTVKMTIDARTRASKMTLTPSAVVVKEGEKSTVGVNYEISKKIQAAGGKATTYKLFVESSDEKVAKAYVEGNNKIVVEGVAKSATPVSITVYSAQVYKLENAKKVKYKLTEKFEVKVSSKLEAKQTGANKITVMGSDLVASKAAFVIKNASGVVLPINDEIKLNDAKTEAVIEGTTTQIPAGKYTLTYNNGDTVEFEVVKAVVKRIEINPTGTAILSADSSEAYAYYKVFNQFDEDVTKNPIAARLSISGSDGVASNAAPKGKVVFKAPGTTKYQLNFSKLSLTIVDLDSGVNASAILTAGEQSKVWEVEYKGLWNVTTRKKVESISQADKLVDYRLLYKAKDQYNNEFSEEFNTTATPPQAIQINLNLVGITGVTAVANPEVITIDGEKVYSFKLTNPASTNGTATREGEVTAQTVVINNGKTTTNKFNVTSSGKIDTLTVRAGALGVYDNQENELDYTALDVNGKPVTNWEFFKELNNAQYIKDANVRFVKEDDGKIVLIYHPTNAVSGGDNASITQILTFMTKTNKFSMANVTVRATRKPVTILGLASDQAKGVAAGQDLEIKASKIRFQDQYGNSMDADEFASAGYKIKVKLTNPKNKDASTTNKVFKIKDASTGIVADPEATTTVNINSADAKVIDFAKDAPSGTATVKVELELQDSTGAKVPGSENKTIDLYYVQLADMTSFKVKTPELVPAKNLTVVDNSDKGFGVKVFGYYAGEKVALGDNDYTVFGAVMAGRVPVQEIDTAKEGIVVKKDKGRVIINDGKGTTVDFDFEYSNAPRKVAKVDFTDTDANMTVASTAIGWAGLSPKNDDGMGITVKDQYDQPSGEIPYITFSDFDKEHVEITKNGATDATILVKPANQIEQVTIKLSFPGSTYTIEKVIKVKGK